MTTMNDVKSQVKSYVQKAESSKDWGDYWDNVYRASALLGGADSPETENKIVTNLVSRMKKQPE